MYLSQTYSSSGSDNDIFINLNFKLYDNVMIRFMVRYLLTMKSIAKTFSKAIAMLTFDEICTPSSSTTENMRTRAAAKKSGYGPRKEPDIGT